jgi:hypothetical protein
MNKITSQALILIAIIIFNANGKWVRSLDGLSTCLGTCGNKLLAGVSQIGLFSSSDTGRTWSQIDQNYFNTTSGSIISPLAIAQNGSTVMVSMLGNSTRSNIFTSDVTGTVWTPRSSNGLSGISINYLTSNGTYFFAGINSAQSIFTSINSGMDWIASSAGLPDNGNFSDVSALANSGTTVLVGYNYPYGFSSSLPNPGFYQSNDNGTTWTLANTGLPVNASITAITVNSGNIYISTSVTNGTIIYGSVYHSTNNGLNWTNISSNLYLRPTSIAVSGVTIFLSSSDRGIFQNNNGKTWTAIDTTGLPSLINDYYNLLCFNGYLFVKAGGSGIFRRPLSELVGTNIATVKISDKKVTKIKLFGNTLIYTVSSTCFVELCFYNLSGKKTIIIEQGIRYPGEYLISLQNKKLPAGIYAYSFQTGEANLLEKGCFAIENP